MIENCANVCKDTCSFWNYDIFGKLYDGYISSQQSYNFRSTNIFLVLGIVNLKPSTNKGAIALGDSSYSTYLVQILTIPLFFKTIHTFHLMNLSGEALGLASVLFTVLIGHFMFWKIEKYFDTQIY